ncbi:MAG: hypothetical protein K6E93_00775 [Bacteroidales bacterium]|nr:hypothetical protein [Bacteroidales bacterium]
MNFCKLAGNYKLLFVSHQICCTFAPANPKEQDSDAAVWAADNVLFRTTILYM